MYNYLKNEVEDVKNYILENYDEEDYSLIDKDELYDELFGEDAVTGNGSGSYTFNALKSKEYVLDNINLLKEASEEFCYNVSNDFLSEEWEKMDVTIRCYLLSKAIDEAIKELEEEEEQWKLYKIKTIV